MNETLQGIITLETHKDGEEDDEEEEGVEEGGMEGRESFLVLKKVRETVKECQELLRSGQGLDYWLNN